MGPSQNCGQVLRKTMLGLRGKGELWLPARRSTKLPLVDLARRRGSVTQEARVRSEGGAVTPGLLRQ